MLSVAKSMRVALLIPLTMAVASTATVVSSDWAPAARQVVRTVPEREVRLAAGPTAATSTAPSMATETERTMRRHGAFATDSAVWPIAVSPDGRYVASSHDDDVVRVWDAETGRQIGRTVHIHTATLTWSRDSAMLAIAGGLRIRVWNIAAGTRPIMLTRPYPHSEQVVFGRYGNHISNDENIWDLHTGRLISTSEPEIEEEVLPADHSEVDSDEAFEETDSDEGLSDAPFTGPSTNAPIGLGGGRRAGRVVVAPRGGWRVRFRGGKMTIESTATGRTLADIDGCGDEVAISADNRWIYSTGGGKSEVRIWDGWTGAPRGKIELPAKPTCLAAGAHYVWVGCADGSIRRYRTSAFAEGYGG